MYALIIMMYTHVYGGTAVALNSIDNFQTEAACRIAGDQAMHDFSGRWVYYDKEDYRTNLNYQCVRKN